MHIMLFGCLVVWLFGRRWLCLKTLNLTVLLRQTKFLPQKLRGHEQRPGPIYVSRNGPPSMRRVLVKVHQNAETIPDLGQSIQAHSTPNGN